VKTAFAKEEFDFVADVSAELPMWVFSEIMGLPVDDRRLLIDLGDKLLGNTDPEVMGAHAVAEQALRDAELRKLPFASPYAAELMRYGRSLGEARRREPRADVTTKLVEAEVDGSPTPRSSRPSSSPHHRRRRPHTISPGSTPLRAP
jgi:cytochrome P450